MKVFVEYKDQERQKCNCTDCNIIEEREVLY